MIVLSPYDTHALAKILTEPHSQRRHSQRTWTISSTSGMVCVRFFYMEVQSRRGPSCTNHRRMLTWRAWTTFMSDSKPALVGFQDLTFTWASETRKSLIRLLKNN